MSDAVAQLAREAPMYARDILEGIFREAFAQEDLFPEYETHIIDAVRDLPVRVVPDLANNTMDISIDFALLGSYKDLELGFHRGASLSGVKGRVELPYRGEELANGPTERLIFWLHLLAGEPVPMENGGFMQTAGLLAETIADRVNTWSDVGKAPEWLLLEFGLKYGAPRVEAHHIMDQWETQMYEYLDVRLTLIVDRAVSVFNSMVSYGAAGVKPRIVGTNLIQAPAGETWVVNGKTYRPGQFIPHTPSEVEVL